MNARRSRIILTSAVAAVFLLFRPAVAADQTSYRGSVHADSSQASLYSKISSGISVALADEGSAFIVKRIAIRALNRRPWPRRPSTAQEIPTDHIFQAGFRFKF